MRLYAPTQSLRATVSQEIRVVLGPDDTAPVGSVRRVQILVPAEPIIYFGFDVDIGKLGPNKVKRLPQLASGAAVRVDLLPHQTLVMAADFGMAEPALIIEYIEDP